MICFAKYIYAELFPDLTMLECKDCAVKHKCNLPAKEETAITNYDRIRAMSDEELAEWAWGIETAGRAYGPRGRKAWLDWLKEEVGE